MTMRPTGVRRALRSRWARGVPLVGVVTLVATGLVSPTPKAHAVVNAQTMTLTNNVAKVGLERTLHSDRPTEMVGFDWDGASTGTLEVRTREGSSWGPWQSVQADPDEGPDLNSREHHDRTSAGPVWVGHNRRDFQVRVTGGELSHLRVHAIRSEETTGSNPRALKPAGAEPAYPNIISRAGWGADESWRTCPP